MRPPFLPPVKTIRCRLLRTLAQAAPSLHHAVVGIDPELSAWHVASGVMRWLKKKRCGPNLPRIAVFHWGACIPRLQGMARREEEKMTYAEIFHSIDAGKAGRVAWAKAIEAMLIEGLPAFGLIVHCGEGKHDDIRWDLECLKPMTDDRTIIVVLGRDRNPHARRAHLDLLREGWHNIELGSGISLLQRAVRIPERYNSEKAPSHEL